MKSLRTTALTLGLLTVAPTAFAQDAAAPPPAVTAPAPAAPAPPPMPGVVVQVMVPGPSDPVERLASMQLLMARLEEPSRQYRYVGGLTAVGLGVVTVPLAGVMLQRGSSTEMGPVILLGLGIGEIIGGGFVLITPGSFASGYAPIVDRIAAGRKVGEPAEKTLADAERIWQERAEAAHDGRRALGGIALTIGAIATITGVALDAAKPLGGLDRADQDGFSAAAFGIGYAAILASVRSFVFPTPVEQSWQVYRGGGLPPLKPTVAKLALNGIQPIQVRGGMGLGWGATF